MKEGDAQDDEFKIALGTHALGKMIDADEINAEAKGNYVIARYWWD